MCLGSRYSPKTFLMARYRVQKRKHQLRKYLLGDDLRDIGEDAGEAGNGGEGEAEFIEDVGGGTENITWMGLAGHLCWRRARAEVPRLSKFVSQVTLVGAPFERNVPRYFVWVKALTPESKLPNS